MDTENKIQGEMPYKPKAEDCPPHPKVHSIAHESRMRKPWIIMPIGYYYNQDLQKAQEGDILLFSDGKRREIEKIGIVPLRNWLTGYLCRKTYGIPLKGAWNKWKANATFDGYGEAALSRDECLLIFLKEE